MAARHKLPPRHLETLLQGLVHAKILKGVRDPQQQLTLCKRIIAQGLSVHGTEAILKTEKPEPKAATSSEPPPEKTAHVQAIEDELRQRFATQVEIRVKSKDKGQIVLSFETNDDFMRLLEFLRK